jgi:hypothetical protein
MTLYRKYIEKNGWEDGISSRGREMMEIKRISPWNGDSN